ncbi:sugar phosphate isomerase/epimerase family protein [Candidatus Laterigemmans baculatus]|uniref:sugar phosphate isomerase/epimerase family protein n=1 Tax=Candidatus Laterigemmans baculatus TaxID=2770505 RepID=UPI0013DA346A|nr:sugar phosphate isomerase/epimerase [Candidatus Laterigemmans baculatus]
MQLGFLTAILPELSLDEVLRIATKFGYECLEVCCWPPSRAERRYSGITHIDIDSIAGDDAATGEVRRKFDDHGIAISGLAYYPNVLTPDEAEASAAVAHLRRVIETAPELGVRQVNTFIGRDWNLSVEDNWPRFLDTWTPLIELAAKHDVNVGIENCPMIFTADEWPGGKNLASNPAFWQRMFEAIPDPHFGLNYDPSHMIWQAMDYLQPMREFADRISHVHAKDVRVDQQRRDRVGVLGHPNDYHSPKLPGLGDVDWGKFFSILTDAGYNGPVCVEVEDRAYEATLEDRLRALEQSYRYLSQYVV